MQRRLAWGFYYISGMWGWVEVRASIHRSDLLWLEFSTEAKGRRMGLSYQFDQKWGKRKKEVGLKSYQ